MGWKGGGEGWGGRPALANGGIGPEMLCVFGWLVCLSVAVCRVCVRVYFCLCVLCVFVYV